MTYALEHLQQTGRTYRMIMDAIKLANDGRAVYVIFATHQAAKHAWEKYADEYNLDQLGIKFEEPQSIGFDFKRGRSPGAHPNCVFLVDHYAIEFHYGPEIQLLHQYDKPHCTADQIEQIINTLRRDGQCIGLTGFTETPKGSHEPCDEIDWIESWWVDQNGGGITGDSFYGTIYIEMYPGKYAQFEYSM